MKALSAVKPKTYQDSLKLMRVSEEVKRLPGVEQASAFMGTDANKRLGVSVGLKLEDVEEAGPDDLIMLVQGVDEDSVKKALQLFEEKIDASAVQSFDSMDITVQPRSIGKALTRLPEANVAVISVPGEYATLEALKALNLGLNVHIFSDNVSVADEVFLKGIGKSRNLFVMGPDCGTSIIHQTPICFANSVSPGPIGVVGASGTGIQEATSIIDKLGSGITHAIGTGGRDLWQGVGGTTTLMALNVLANDTKTEVILLISKAPDETVRQQVIEAVKKVNKKCVLLFLGKKVLISDSSSDGHVYFASGIEEAAAKAVALTKKERAESVVHAFQRDSVEEAMKNELSKKKQKQKYLHGLYSGGSLAEESLHVISEILDEKVITNIANQKEIEYPANGKGNYIIDLGGDEFTRGRLHPMIDPSYRAEKIIESYCNPEVAVILCDVVIGYGSHRNPAGAVIDAIEKAKKLTDNHVTVVASVCGTKNDPQNLSKQEALLKGAGVFVFPSNQYAAEVAGEIARRSSEGGNNNERK